MQVADPRVIGIVMNLKTLAKKAPAIGVWRGLSELMA